MKRWLSNLFYLPLYCQLRIVLCFETRRLERLRRENLELKRKLAERER